MNSTTKDSQVRMTVGKRVHDKDQQRELRRKVFHLAEDLQYVSADLHDALKNNDEGLASLAMARLVEMGRVAKKWGE